MKKIGIIGAGNMGSGIAQNVSQEGFSVVLMDTKSEFVQKGFRNIKSALSEAVDRKILLSDQRDSILGRIQETTDLNEVKDCDLVIEAVFEDMKVKEDLFSKLGKICDDKTILATNTSSLSVNKIAKSTNRPERFIGLHFFYHPAKNRLIEIIPGELTSPDTLSAVRMFSKLIGKIDILVKDSPGFAVNRYFVPFVNEAARCLEEGIANIPTIDKAIMDLLGIGMGPFMLMNAAGIPIAYHAQKILFKSLGSFYSPAKRLAAQFESGKQWSSNGDIEEEKIEEVCDRLLGATFFVTTSMLEEGVADVTDIDVGAKVGLRWKKGPFEIMNELGITKAHTLVDDLLKSYPDVDFPEVLSAQRTKGEPWNIRYVKYTREGRLGRVRISRPEALNSLNPIVVRQLDEAFLEAESDIETKAVIIEGAGKAFVAGADTKYFVDCIKEDRISDIHEFTSYVHDVMNRIDNSKKLVIAKLEGLAFGGGLELAISADKIVATSKAMLGFPETGIGIYPGGGGTQRTSRKIGKELAKYLIFTGRIISAEQAQNIGLIDYVFDPFEIEQKIDTMIDKEGLNLGKDKEFVKLPNEWEKIKKLFSDENVSGWLSDKYMASNDPLEAKTARIIAGKAPLALRVTNKIMDMGYGKDLRDGLKLELDHLIDIFSTKDALTGLLNVGQKDIQFEGK